LGRLLALPSSTGLSWKKLGRHKHPTSEGIFIYYGCKYFYNIGHRPTGLDQSNGWTGFTGLNESIGSTGFTGLNESIGSTGFTGSNKWIRSTRSNESFGSTGKDDPEYVTINPRLAKYFWIPGPNIIKLFTAVIYGCSYLARVFVSGGPLQPSLM
jgi:hypothetical protein